MATSNICIKEDVMKSTQWFKINKYETIKDMHSKSVFSFSKNVNKQLFSDSYS